MILLLKTFLVFTTGMGARLIGSEYDQIATETDAYISCMLLDRGGFTLS